MTISHVGQPRGLLAEEARWYALTVRSRFEKKAHSDLTSRDLESFLPLIEEVHIWSDRKKKVWEPLFRGYLFVRTNLRNKLSILQTDGVVRFVQLGTHPSPIPDNQIEWIRIFTGHPVSVRHEAYLSKGEKVRVTSGPFQGIEGVVVHSRGAMRMVISLDAIAQSVSVEISPSMVARCSESVMPAQLLGGAAPVQS